MILRMSGAAASDETLTRDQLEAIGEEIATFAARIDVAEHALIERLQVFDAHEAWGNSKFPSCAHWLSWRTGIGIKAAREKVRVARALTTLGKINGLFGRGELSYSKVRAITRVATPETEQDFVDIAPHATASQIERLCRAYQRCRTDPKGNEEPRDQRRFMRRAETLGGMIRIEMQLPPEEAALVWDAMESALDAGDDDEAETSSKGTDAAQATASAQQQDSAEASEPSHPGAESTPDAEAATEDSAESSGAPLRAACSAGSCSFESANDGKEHEERRADAMVDVARAYLRYRPRTLGSGYELVIHTSKEQLEQGPGGVGGHLRDGTPIPLHIARMLACDSSRIDVVTGKDGELLDVGRSTRTIPSAVARALWIRDGGCRVPGFMWRPTLCGGSPPSPWNRRMQPARAPHNTQRSRSARTALGGSYFARASGVMPAASRASRFISTSASR
jgi:hypothetical protein